MISEGIMHLLTNILSDLPVISLGSNFSAGLNFLNAGNWLYQTSLFRLIKYCQF